MKRTTKIAIAVTVLIAVGGLLAWLAPSGGRALAFNDLAEAFAKIHSATCTIRSEAETSQGKMIMRGKSMYLAPARERSEFSPSQVSGPDGSTMTASAGITILDYQKGEGIVLSPQTKMAQVFKLENLPADRPLSSFQQLRRMVSVAQGDKTDNAEPLGHQMIDGRKTVGFRIREGGFEYKIWAEPSTALPVRVEVDSQLKPASNFVMSDFRFNVELDESLFSLEVPEGYTANRVKMDASETTAEDLAQTLRIVAEHSEGFFPAELLNMEDIYRGITKSLIAEHGPGDSREAQNAVAKAMAELGVELGRGINFILKLTPEHDWHYAGKDVKLNTPNRPIFWYKPIGKEDYQVIYADLSVKEVASEELPKVSQPTAEASPATATP